MRALIARLKITYSVGGGEIESLMKYTTRSAWGAWPAGDIALRP